MKTDMDYDHYVQVQSTGNDWSYNSTWGDQMADAMKWWCSECQPGTILDIGCGEGRGVSVASSLGFKATGLDICVEKIVHGKNIDDLDLHQGDFHKLPWRDNEFEYSFFSHALEHALDAEQALREMIRVTSKKGFLIVPIEPGKTSVGPDDPHTHYFNSEEEWYALCDKFEGLRFEHTSKHRLGQEVWTVFYVEESNSES